MLSAGVGGRDAVGELRAEASSYGSDLPGFEVTTGSRGACLSPAQQKRAF